MKKGKIFCFCTPLLTGEYKGYAIDLDGNCLSIVHRDTKDDVMRDLGISSVKGREVYSEEFSKGYDLYWVDFENTTEYPKDFVSAIKKCDCYTGISFW